MHRFFKIIILLLIIFVLCSCGKKNKQDFHTIGIFQFAPDPAVYNCRKGFIKALEDEGFKDGVNIKIEYKNAQADFMTIQTIVDGFISKKVDMIVPITTPCVQAAAAKVKDINVVFTGIYDPYIAGAAKSPEDHAPNITGVGSFPPVEEAIEFALKILPDIKKLGTIWNTSELCSEAALIVARKVCEERRIELIEITVTNANEVLQSAQALADKKIDVFFIVGDNTVLTSFDSIVKVSEEQQIPIIMNDPEFVERGALAALGFDFYESGYAGGKIAARVLRGESPADIPIQSVVVPRLIINLENARLMEIEISEEIVETATEIIGREEQE